MGGLKNFRSRLRRSPKFLHIYSYTWAPAEKFPEWRKTTHTFKNRPLFRRAEDQTTICAFFTTFETKLKGVYCKRRGRERKFKGVFKIAEYDVIFQFHGKGWQVLNPPPGPPLQHPMPMRKLLWWKSKRLNLKNYKKIFARHRVKKVTIKIRILIF